jgi:uncharacterized delta-60 repeat protein
VASSISVAASTNVTVSVSVPSAGWVDAANCATDTADVTDFDTILTNTKNVTGTNCNIKFGASNATASLRVYQEDAQGAAMWLAGNGSQDNSFDTDGAATTDISGANDIAHSIVQQPDGKLVVAGEATGATLDFAVARYNEDGSLDTSFGGGDGFATIDVIGENEIALGVAIQPDGNIVLAGKALGTSQAAVVRLTPAGVLDTSFSGDGKLNFQMGAGATYLSDVGVQSNGQVLLAGYAVWAGNYDFAVVRLLQNGTFDPSFGGGDGIANADVSIGSEDYARSMEIMPDDRIVLAGQARPGSDQFGVARLLSNGDVDNSFSGDGVVTADFPGGFDSANGVAVQSDDKVIAVGEVLLNSPWWDMALVRYNADGTLDTSFGGTGQITMDATIGVEDKANAVTVQRDGAILVAGSKSGQLIVSRLNETNGSLDSDFGTNGSITVAGNIAYDIIEDAGGRIVGIGQATGATFDFGIVRRGALETSDYVDDGSADWDTAGSLELFGACLLSVADGATAGGSAWTTTGTCAANDSSPWNAIPAASPGAKIAYTAAADAQGGATDPAVNLRFGVRTRLNQEAGTYFAPIVFEAVAPNA